MAKPAYKDKGGQPSAAERNKIGNWLQAKGVPPGKINQMVKAGVPRQDIIDLILLYLAGLPKG